VTNTSPRQRAAEVQSETAKQRAYRLLRADILRGVYDMGERLNENQLALRYGLGKTPVREALGILQQEGLVEALPRVGYLTSWITLKEVDDIFDLREILEGASAEKAALSISDTALERLEKLRWNFDAGDRQSYLEFLDENMEFHRTVAQASGNQMLVEAVERLLEKTQRLVILRLDISGSLDELVSEHRGLLDALRERDPARARTHMVADITNTHRFVLESLRKLMANWRL
jgi:DNA-binding GntR family transcriptional regulator